MFLRADFNPFAARTFHATEHFHKFLNENSRTQGEDRAKGLGRVPFVRMIDGWLLAAALGSETVDLDSPLSEASARNFAPGSVLQKDPGAIEFLMLLAISVTGDSKIIDDPIAVIKVAWQCAESGFPKLQEIVQTGGINLLENMAGNLELRVDKNISEWVDPAD